MRRLMLILLAMIALGSMLPAAPAAASRHAATMGAMHGMPAAPCHEDRQSVGHLCVGCITLPEARPAVAEASVTLRPLPPAFAIVTLLEGRRPGLDPPPPRHG